MYRSMPRVCSSPRSARKSPRSAEALIFSVAEDDPDAPSGRREVARSAARQADFVLPPGTYYVIARLGSIEARESLAVGPGDVVKRTLSVAAGRLALATKPMGTTSALNEPVSYRVERIDGSSQDAITTSRPSPVLLLLGGRYRVEGRYGVMNARVVREIEVKAGQTQQLTLEHQAASLRLRLVGGGGAALTRCSGTSRTRPARRCGPRARRSRRRRCRRGAIALGPRRERSATTAPSSCARARPGSSELTAD